MFILSLHTFRLIYKWFQNYNFYGVFNSLFLLAFVTLKAKVP